MSSAYVIDEAHRVVFSRAAGEFTYADVATHMDRLQADARFRPDMSQILDFSDVVAIAITNDQIRELASRKVFGPGSHRAFVAPADYEFGLARMFQAHREFEGETGITVFRKMAEAVSWIGVPADVVEKAFAELRKADAGR